MSIALDIHAVSKRFGALTALDDVSLAVQAGEFFALLGPNGAGKTTLISCMAGLTRPDSGHVGIMGHDVQLDYRAARRALCGPVGRKGGLNVCTLGAMCQNRLLF